MYVHIGQVPNLFAVEVSFLRSKTTFGNRSLKAKKNQLSFLAQLLIVINLDRKASAWLLHKIWIPITMPNTLHCHPINCKIVVRDIKLTLKHGAFSKTDS